MKLLHDSINESLTYSKVDVVIDGGKESERERGGGGRREDV